MLGVLVSDGYHHLLRSDEELHVGIEHGEGKLALQLATGPLFGHGVAQVLVAEIVGERCGGEIIDGERRVIGGDAPVDIDGVCRLSVQVCQVKHMAGIVATDDIQALVDVACRETIVI